MPVIASDTFTQADGSVFNAAIWSNGLAPTGGRAVTYHNVGVVGTGAASSTPYDGANRTSRKLTSTTDAEFSGRFRFVGQECYPQIWARSTSSTLDGAGGYAFSVSPNGWDVSRYSGFSGTVIGGGLATATFPLTQGRFYQFRFKVAGSLVQSKIWLDGAAEPAYPALGVATSQASSFTDATITAAGYWGFSVGAGAGTNVIAPCAGISGLPWNSGVFADNGTGQLASSDSFATYRNRSVDSSLYFPPRGAYSGTQLGQLPDGTNGSPNFLARPGYTTITVSTQPELSQNTQDNSTGAGGSATTFWTAYGANIVAGGWNVKNKIIIRANWEFNIPSFAWRSNNPNTATYISAYQNMVTSIRAGGATNVLFNWCFNKGPDQNGTAYTASYPGDSYVDLIGLDMYDHFNPSYTSTDFTNEKARTPSWDAAASFAGSHSKRVWINEWGVSHWPSFGGGDNPFFVGAMFDLFYANSGDGGILAGEDYFNHLGAQAGGVYLEHQLTEGHNPNASNTYKDLSRWGSN